MDWDVLTESSTAGVLRAKRIDTLSKSDEFSLGGLMSRFRDFDRKEFMCMVPDGQTPFNHLVDIVNQTELAHAYILDNGAWQGIGGCGWYEKEQHGCSWLLLSPVLPRDVPHLFRRLTRRINDIYIEHYSPLANYVHADAPSHRWLEWLGYRVHTDTKHYFKDEPFYIFTYGI